MESIVIQINIYLSGTFLILLIQWRFIIITKHYCRVFGEECLHCKLYAKDVTMYQINHFAYVIVMTK